jgi:hypothetical protein
MDRRRFLWTLGGGLGGIALADLLGHERLLAQETPAKGAAPGVAAAADLRGGLHFPARARRVVQLFMSGAASAVDTFDWKPKLLAQDGQKWDPGEKVELFQSDPGACMASPWKFAPRGDCGKQVSELVPCLAQHVDKIAFVHSMVSKSNVHGPATFLQNTGFVLPGFPAMGAWVSYALGRLTDDLPTFVVLPDARGFAPNGPANWSAGFLPAAHQGTMIRPSAATPVADLFPPESARALATPANERDTLALLARLNRDHAAARPGDSRLDARIAAYEMAARLQLSAPDVLDVSGEPDSVRALYGLDAPATADFGKSCLVARRLLERGVRFVQLWSGADNGFPRRNWDSHEDLKKDHADMAAGMDRPAAALLTDLAARGLLDDTVVMWTTEFGRMPCSQGAKGRDHNPFGFTVWLAGGGIRGGVSYGATDEWGFRAVEKPTSNYDVHATVLRLLGIDHTKLTVRHDGIDRRLTDVHGEVLHELIA